MAARSNTVNSPITVRAPEKSSNKTEKSKSKIMELLAFDSKMRKKWLRTQEAVLIGTDEVGRGCLAGPVVAAAVQLPDIEADSELLNLFVRLNDSKKLSPQVRQELSLQLQDRCSYAIAESSVEEIDKINILQASFLAMSRAIEKLCLKKNTVVLVDGNRKISNLQLRQILVVGGDGLSASIAAASVIAKVYRDNLMCRLHDEFPHYHWNSNKGYAAKAHRDAIIEHGLCAWHRQSFCTRIGQEQLSILD